MAEKGYAFRRSKAIRLDRLVGSRQHEQREWTPRPSSGGSSTKLFLTPGGGIPARSGATLGSASCTLLTVTSGTRATTATSATVYNDFLTAISGSVDIIATKIDGIWVVFAEDCT